MLDDVELLTVAQALHEPTLRWVGAEQGAKTTGIDDLDALGLGRRCLTVRVVGGGWGRAGVVLGWQGCHRGGQEVIVARLAAEQGTRVEGTQVLRLFRGR